MQVGDLVRYNDSSEASDPKNRCPELGIITKTDPIGMPMRCHVEWWTCDNRGWWSYENLEIVYPSPR